MTQRFPTTTALLLATFAVTARPALALDVDLETLLADPDTVPEAAIAACDIGVNNPDRTMAALTQAGWAFDDGFGEGVVGFTRNDTSVIFATVSGFCMVEDKGLSTAEMWDALHALGLHALPVSNDAAGCDVADMGGGVTATLTGPGNDPVCTSQTGAALQFNRTEESSDSGAQKLVTLVTEVCVEKLATPDDAFAKIRSSGYKFQENLLSDGPIYRRMALFETLPVQGTIATFLIESPAADSAPWSCEFKGNFEDREGLDTLDAEITKAFALTPFQGDFSRNATKCLINSGAPLCISTSFDIEELSPGTRGFSILVHK
jgi:hypothetical protein